MINHHNHAAAPAAFNLSDSLGIVKRNGFRRNLGAVYSCTLALRQTTDLLRSVHFDTAVGMLSYSELPALGPHLNSKSNSEEVSATAVGGSPNSDKACRLNSIRDLSIAGKEAMARQKARPRVLPARSSTFGFSIGHAPATELVPEDPSDDAEGSGSGNNEGSFATGYHSLKQEDGSIIRLNNMRDNLERAEDPSMEFSRLNGEELALLNHAYHSLLTGVSHMAASPMLQHAAGSSVQPLQLQPAEIPPPHAAHSPTAAAFSFDRPHVALPAHTPAQPPVNELDRLLNGDTPDSERCSRRKPKGALPRTKKTHARQSKQVVPQLRQPLLWRPSSAHTPVAAEAPDAAIPPSLPLEGLDCQPCDGMWRKLGSSLLAVWRWLCKSGCTLKKLSRKVRKKLMTALGLGHDEAQALLAEQQSEEREALVVGHVMPVQHMEQPQGSSRLQRWRM